MILWFTCLKKYIAIAHLEKQALAQLTVGIAYCAIIESAIAFGNLECDRYTINCSNTNTGKPGKDGKRASFVKKNDAPPRIAVAI